MMFAASALSIFEFLDFTNVGSKGSCNASKDENTLQNVLVRKS